MKIPFLTVSMALLLAGCTAKKPEITSLGKLERITFDNSTVSLTSWTISNADGLCLPQVTSIQVSFDGSSYVDITSLDPSATVTCSTTGRFHFQVDFNATSLAATKALLESGQSVTMRGRGLSKNGLTDEGTVSISYQISDSKNGELYVGAGKVTSGAYTLAGRISFPHSISGSTPLASGTYLLKGMIRSQ